MTAQSIQATSPVHRKGSPPKRASAARTRNKILNILPPKELEAVLERCEMVTIESGEIVFRRKEPILYAYFPDNCVISLVTEMEDGDAVEAMTVGNDGFVGMAIFHGVPSSRLKAIGQISGDATRLAADDFRELAREFEGLSRLLHRYSQGCCIATANSYSRQSRSRRRATDSMS